MYGGRLRCGAFRGDYLTGIQNQPVQTLGWRGRIGKRFLHPSTPPPTAPSPPESFVFTPALGSSLRPPKAHPHRGPRAGSPPPHVRETRVFLKEVLVDGGVEKLEKGCWLAPAACCVESLAQEEYALRELPEPPSKHSVE